MGIAYFGVGYNLGGMLLKVTGIKYTLENKLLRANGTATSKTGGGPR